MKDTVGQSKSSELPTGFTAERVGKFECKNGTATFFWDGGTRGVRGLGIKCTPKNQRHPRGTKTYVVEGRLDGKTVRISLGDVRRWTLERARRRAARLRLLLEEGIDPRVKRRQRTEKRKAAEAAAVAKVESADRAATAAQQAAQEAARFILKALCEQYVTHLKAAGKPSGRDAASLFRTHVYKSRFADRPAREVTARDLTELLRGIIEAGHGRTAAKTRSFLRASYQLALRAELDATVPAALMAFSIAANPAASTNALARFNATRDRTLSADELRHYLTRLRASPDTVAKIPLLLCLLLGGQRPAQLVRVTIADVDLAAGTITLRDGKGKRQRPRLHVLPLVGETHTLASELYERRCRQAEQARKDDPEGPAAHGDVPLFALANHRVDPATLSGAVRVIRRAMIVAADRKLTHF